MTLYTDDDHWNLLNNPSIRVPGAGGTYHEVVPFKLGQQQQTVMRRDAQGLLRAYPVAVNGIVPPGFPRNHPLAMAAVGAGTPVAMQHQIKQMQPPTTAPQMRISSNGGMRPPPVLPVSNLQQPNGSAPLHVSPPHPLPVPVSQPPNGVNGISRAAISMPHVDVQKPPEVIATPAFPNGVTPLPQSDPNAELTVSGIPARPKSQNVTPQSHVGLGVPTNGYHLTAMNNMTAAALVNSASYQPNQNPQHAGGLSLQQMQNLKTVFANMPAPELAALQAGRGIPASYMHVGAAVANMNMQIPPGANMNLKLPPSRQMQWMNSPMQRPTPIANGLDSQLNGTAVASPNPAHAVPARSPSANGSRAGMRNGVHINGHSMSPLMQPSPSPIPNIAQSQSPPRIPMTPNMGMASPSLQHQQPVGGNQNGY